MHTVDLLNNGIGPALIQNFQISVDNRAILGEGTEPIEKALKVLFPLYPFSSQQSFIGQGYSMAAKESRPLVAIQFQGDHLPKWEEVEHAMKRVRLLINYSSIYDESFTLDSDKMRFG